MTRSTLLFRRQLVTPLDQRLELPPVDAHVQPAADVYAAPVRRDDEIVATGKALHVRGRGLHRDRRPAFQDLESAKRAAADTKARMTPRDAFLHVRRRQTQLP